MIRYDLNPSQKKQLRIADFLFPIDVNKTITIVEGNNKKEVRIKDFLESCSY